MKAFGASCTVTNLFFFLFCGLGCSELVSEILHVIHYNGLVYLQYKDIYPVT